MEPVGLLDAAGRRRSPATMPGYRRGCPPRNKGLRYPADPPSVEEIVAVMRQAGDGIFGVRVRGLIVVLWRAGLRISEGLALAESDLDAARGSILVRRGKGGRRREIGMDPWAGSNSARGSTTASSCRSDGCSASLPGRRAAARGQPLLHERSCAASPLAPVYGDASHRTNSVMLMQLRWPAKACC